MSDPDIRERIAFDPEDPPPMHMVVLDRTARALEELTRQVRALAVPDPPVRDVVTVALDAKTETLISGQFAAETFRSLTITNRHATATVYAAAMQGAAVDAVTAAKPLSGVVEVPPGRMVTVPLSGIAVSLAGTNAGGTTAVEVIRWPGVMPAGRWS